MSLLSARLLGHAPRSRGAEPESSSISGSRRAASRPTCGSIRVKQGDAVRLRWTSDRPIPLHLHGYDIETKVEPGTTAEMTFTARATGRFPVEEHKPDTRGGHSHGEAPLVRIEVRPALEQARLRCGWRRCRRSPQPRASTPACAHGFGQRYELPLPLGLYLFGAAAVVALSFVVFALFVRRPAAAAVARTWTVRAAAARPDRRPPRRRSGASARRACAVRRRDAGRPVRRPESLPQYRPDPGVDRLVGGTCLHRGLRRRRLGARQPLAHRVRRGAMARPIGSAGMARWACT